MVKTIKIHYYRPKKKECGAMNYFTFKIALILKLQEME
jgi:hypothetical protein